MRRPIDRQTDRTRKNLVRELYRDGGGTEEGNPPIPVSLLSAVLSNNDPVSRLPAPSNVTVCRAALFPRSFTTFHESIIDGILKARATKVFDAYRAL